MGARFVNNPKVKSSGYVDQTLALDIRVLRKAGFIVEGQQKRGRISSALADLSFIADLVKPGDPHLLVQLPGSEHRQFIGLRSRPTQFGGQRWFFLDEVGHLCEKLYFVGQSFASRERGRLTYRSQSLGSLDRILHRRETVQRRLAGKRGRGPARGRVREKLAAELQQIAAGLEGLGAQMLHSFAAPKAGARARREASRQRLEAAASAMTARQDVPSQQVIGTFTALVDDLKQGAKKGPRSRSEAPLESDEARPHVDLSILRRLGYVTEGKILGDQLGWPEAWLPEPDRSLFFLIDARASRRRCAVFIVQDPDRITKQLFWLTRVEGLFGRQEDRFVCPHKGILSSRLIYEDGQFTCPSSPEASEEQGSSLPDLDLSLPGLELG